ncbi:NEW3 domain-containing protein [uncultured Cohaesibacter sp.]|uniref:COG1470 family protein n=1 Tax=uncultured Cohaesibacter sp. TaxID=1002546 RepID=UPI0029C7E220|nr:NEW3 domain-containing protein [uncultured Cohaesibacter sp.]
MESLAKCARLALFGAVLAATPILTSNAFAEAFTQPASGPAIHGFWLTADHPDVAVSAGKTVSIPLSLLNALDQPVRTKLDVKGLPDGWTYSIKAGGSEVASAMPLPNEIDNLTLMVVPPKDAKKQVYDFEVDAVANGDQFKLPLSVAIADIPLGDTTLVPELPALHGTVNTSFEYKMKLTNGSNHDILFNLGADAPDGFNATFKKGYGTEEITGIPVKAGATESVSMTIKLNHNVSEGDYPIEISAVAGPDDPAAKAKVSLKVSGSPRLALSGPNERLSGQATAGTETTFPFVLVNNGTAAASKVKLSATSPSDWKVSFDPKELDKLEAGKTQNVNVKIQPSSKAIAGDYMVQIRANGDDGVSKEVDYRVTVETSTMWGIIGVAIIAIAVIVLLGAIFRYGRR